MNQWNYGEGEQPRQPLSATAGAAGTSISALCQTTVIIETSGWADDGANHQDTKAQSDGRRMLPAQNKMRTAAPSQTVRSAGSLPNWVVAMAWAMAECGSTPVAYSLCLHGFLPLFGSDRMMSLLAFFRLLFTDSFVKAHSGQMQSIHASDAATLSIDQHGAGRCFRHLPAASAVDRDRCSPGSMCAGCWRHPRRNLW